MSQKAIQGIPKRPYTMKSHLQKQQTQSSAVLESLLKSSGADYSLDALTSNTKEGNKAVLGKAYSRRCIPFPFATSQMRSQYYIPKNSAVAGYSSDETVSHKTQSMLLLASSGVFSLPVTANTFLIEPNTLAKPTNDRQFVDGKLNPLELPSWRDGPNLDRIGRQTESMKGNVMALGRGDCVGAGREREETILPKLEEDEFLSRELFESSLPSTARTSANGDLLPGAHSSQMEAACEARFSSKHGRASAESFLIPPQKRQRRYQRRNSVVIKYDKREPHDSHP